MSSEWRSAADLLKYSGTVQPIREVVPEQTDRQEPYQWNDGRERQRRPIDGYIPTILAKLARDQVVVVQADTGVGKTTRIGQAIVDNDSSARVFMTQTRRPAVRMNGGFIAQELGCEPGDIVGWRLRNEEPKISDKTRLTLMIDQSLTNRIRREGKLPDGTIILDEAHERTIQIDIALALIKQYLPDSPNTKLLITSATIDTQKFKEFFHSGDPVLAMNGHNFPIDVRPQQLLYGEHHTEGAVRAAKHEVLDKFANGELTVPDTQKPEEQVKVSSGSILVLLPGKDDIANAMEEVSEYAKKMKLDDRIEIMQCHGQMTTTEQQQIEKQIEPGTLRFVFATEIVRSSVTVPNTVGVIDSLQVKRQTIDAHGVSHLQKVTVSGAEADQGKGRVGRQNSGFYIPISFNNEYEHITNRTNSEYWPVPAIKREASSSVVLQVAATGLDIRTLDMLDKPSDEKIATAIKRLQNLDALDEEGKITELGQKLAEFPIEPERAMVLLEAEKRGVLPEAMISMAVLVNEGITFVPRKTANDIVVDKALLQQIIRSDTRRFDYNRGMELMAIAEGKIVAWSGKSNDGKHKLDFQNPYFPLGGGAREVAGLVWQQFAQGTDSDFYAAVQAFRAYKTEEQRLYDSFNPATTQDSQKKWVNRKLQSWCKEHFLNAKKLGMVERTINELRDVTKESGMRLGSPLVQEREFSNEDLTKSLLVGLTDGISVQNSGRIDYTGPKADVIRKPYTSACKNSPQIILADGITKDARGGIARFASMIAALHLDWIKEVTPKVLTESIDVDTVFYDTQTDKVMASRQTKIGPTVLKESEDEITGEVAVKAFAKALLRGEVALQVVQQNKNVVEQLRNYALKTQTQVVYSDNDLLALYVQNLGDIHSQAALEEALATNSKTLEQMTFNIDNFVPREERERVEALYPDTIYIQKNTGNELVAVTYNNSVYYSYARGWTNTFQAEIKLTVNELLQVDAIPQLPSGDLVTIRIVRNAQDSIGIASGTDLDMLRRQISHYQTDMSRYGSYGQSVLRTTIPDTSYRRGVLDESYLSVPVNETDGPTARDKRFTMLKNYEELSTTQLQKIMIDEKRQNQGKYRLAIAALANKGEEGIAALLGVGLTDTKVLDAVKLTLDKVRREATRDQDTYDYNREVKEKIDQTIKALDMYERIKVAISSPVIHEFLGDDVAAKKVFREKLYGFLKEQRSLPDNFQLENIIAIVLDEMTT